MAEQVMDGSGLAMPPEGVCIHTNKITDVCLDKDCIEDLRVYLTADSQARLDASAGARVRSVELLWVDIDVEELGFQRGYAAVELTFYYRVRGETGTGTAAQGKSHLRTRPFQQGMRLHTDRMYRGGIAESIHGKRHGFACFPAQGGGGAVIQINHSHRITVLTQINKLQQYFKTMLNTHKLI